MGTSKKKLNQPQKFTKIEKAREAKIYQADTLLQKGRFELSLNERRLILYTVAHIKPTDDRFKEYTFKLKDLYEICGIHGNDSYTEIKKNIAGLRDKAWWITMEDPNEPGTECESRVSWFAVTRTNKRSGKFTVMFHPDMMPYLLELSHRRADGGGYYTQYTFQYVLPMKSQYSIRLYELLKSYQKNNMSWYFQIEDLKRLLDCRHYARFADFRRFALEPAIKEINEYSDIRIKHETEKDGKRIDTITFFMVEKATPEKLEAQKKGLTALDGKVHYWDKDDEQK